MGPALPRSSAAPPLGWERSPAGGWSVEPVETPLGADPDQIRAWIRCRNGDCNRRVEILTSTHGIPDTTRARAAHLRAVIAEAGPGARCDPCAAAAWLLAHPAPARPAGPAPLVLPTYLADLIRSGRPAGPRRPRGETGCWLAAQAQLRILAVDAPAHFAALMPAVLAALRPIAGWLPYWTDFLAFYRLPQETP